MSRPIDEIMAELRAKVRPDATPTATASPSSGPLAAPASPIVVGFVPFVSRKMERRRNHTRSEFVRLANAAHRTTPDTPPLFGVHDGDSQLELVLFGDWFGIDIAAWAIDAGHPYEIVLPYGDAPCNPTPGPSIDDHSNTDRALGEAKHIHTMSREPVPEAWPAARRYVYDHADTVMVLANGSRRWKPHLIAASALCPTWLIHSDARPSEEIHHDPQP